MITSNDIGKQFFDTGFGRIVTLKALDMVGPVPMANVYDPDAPNPGSRAYWVRTYNLSAVQG